MQYEFIRLEKLLNAINTSSCSNPAAQELQRWNKELLEEKEVLLKNLTATIKNKKEEKEKVNKYILYHHHRLIDLLKEVETFPKPVRGKLTNSLKDIMLYLELNFNDNTQYYDGSFNSKCFMPLSVEVISFLFRILWEEGIIKMKFKSHLITMLCSSISTLKAGMDGNISEKHFSDSMYHVKESTLASAERILNRLKMRLNKIRQEET